MQGTTPASMTLGSFINDVRNSHIGGSSQFIRRKLRTLIFLRGMVKKGETLGGVFYRCPLKDCLKIIRTLILLSIFAVNFHAFNFKPGEV